MPEHVIDINNGLSENEINSRIEQGKTNAFSVSASKSTWEIIKSNSFNFFNLLILCLVTLIFITGSIKNALFINMVIINTAVGIFQEIRARRAIEKLSLMNKTPASVVRGGQVCLINREEIVLDDICVLKKGSQIPADAVIVSDDVIEVDESMLTGESRAVSKTKGDKVYGGSLMLAGIARAQSCGVGKDSYVNKLSAEAKVFKQNKSKLQRQIDRIIKLISIIIVPASAFLLISQIFFVDAGIGWRLTVLQSASAVIGMIPSGLVFLTSAALAVGVLSLTRKKVLTQELSAIETLARVDVLCLDKTGTLTEGTLKVSKMVCFYENEDYVKRIFSSFVKADDEQNATTAAIGAFFGDDCGRAVKRKIPFSSEKKWQAAEFENEGSFIFGAPDILIPSDESDVLEIFNEAVENGQRVLALLKCDDFPDEELPQNRKALALIMLEDKIREDAAETISYFKSQNVDLRIISGDHPAMISRISESVGISGSCIDASELPVDSNSDKFRQIVNKTAIFGRVKPDQKKQIVEALQANGHIVAMTGDGVNDILALKKADCGIAMGSGSEAAQSVSHFVLLDGKFSSMPAVVAEGRRVINNVNRVASLFLIKTIYSLLLAFILGIAGMQYPFRPIHLTLPNLLVIGIPSFLLALEPNYNVVKGDFMKKALYNSAPGAVAIAITVFLTMFFNQLIFNFDSHRLVSVAIIIIVIIHLLTLFLISYPLSKWRAGVLALILFLCTAVLFIRPLLRFLEFPPLYLTMVFYTAGLCVLAVLLTLLFRIIAKRFLLIEN